MAARPLLVEHPDGACRLGYRYHRLNWLTRRATWLAMMINTKDTMELKKPTAAGTPLSFDPEAIASAWKDHPGVASDDEGVGKALEIHVQSAAVGARTLAPAHRAHGRRNLARCSQDGLAGPQATGI